MLQALSEIGLAPDLVVGTSVGSVINTALRTDQTNGSRADEYRSRAVPPVARDPRARPTALVRYREPATKKLGSLPPTSRT